MLTIFACPKPFQGRIAVIQRNAITSWSLLSPRPEVILLGDEEGAGEICKELGLRHIPLVARNSFGTPLLNGVFEQAHQSARYKLLCYVNADIILMSDFMLAVRRAQQLKGHFLLIGQRWDVDIQEPWDFAQTSWEEALRGYVLRRGHPHQRSGVDYFVFTAGLFDPIPPFALGRPAFDNWFIYRARSRWVPVIEASPVVMAVHQNHDYSHIPLGEEGFRNGYEARSNFALAGGHEHMFWLDDRTHLLSHTGLKPDLSLSQLRRHWQRLPVLVPPFLCPLLGLIRKMWGFFPRHRLSLSKRTKSDNA